MNTEAFAPFLFELLAKSALILAAAALIERAWLRASAAQRHLVWCAALGTLLVLPLTHGFEPRWTVPLQRIAVELPPAAHPDLASIQSVPATELNAVPLPAAPRWRWPDGKHAVLWAWLAGTGLLLTVRLLGSLRLVWLRRTTRLLADARAQPMATEIFRALGIRRHVELRLSPTGYVPLTWGSVRPVLTLPVEALEWHDGALAAALRHEAGHIARADHLTRWIAQLACIFYWPNPLVWIAAARLRAAQEEATDDLVLRAGTAPDEYAAQLFDVARTLVARHRLARHAVAMASPSTLERRMLAIVDARRDRRPLSARALLGGALAMALTLALSTAAQLQAQEKKAAAESATDSAPQQIMVEARFVELTAEAKAKLLSPLFAPTFPDSATPKTISSAMALSGVLTEAQLDEVLRGLNQQRGVDILSTPRVTMKSGQRAQVESIRDFRYPTEYEKDGQGWKAKEFETRKVGVSFEVEAALGPDGYTLDLDLKPSVVEFLGWNDLETGKKIPASTKPNQSIWERLDSAAALPAGHRGQPIFSERKITTTVTIFGGQTVVLGALGEPVENKDFPTKQPPRQLVIFVTAKILDEAPQPKGADAAPKPASPVPGDPDPAEKAVLRRAELREATLAQAAAAVTAAGDVQAKRAQLEQQLADLKAKTEALTARLAAITPAAATTPAATAAGNSAGAPAGPGSDSRGDLFLRAYQAFQKSAALEDQGKLQEAVTEIRRCIATLDELTKLDPQWNPQIVAYRKKRAEEAEKRVISK